MSGKPPFVNRCDVPEEDRQFFDLVYPGGWRVSRAPAQRIEPRSKRRAVLEKALSGFALQRHLSALMIERLREELIDVPEAVLKREKQKLAHAGMHDASSVWWPKGRALILAFPQMDRRSRERYRKQLARTGTLLMPARRGRPLYEYIELEAKYARAIMKAAGLAKFPRSKNAEGEYTGPAFELLHAAMALALFASGPGSRVGRAKRVVKIPAAPGRGVVIRLAQSRATK